MFDLSHVERRVALYQIEADAEADLALTREARAVWRLFIKYIKAAKLKPKFFEGARATDLATGIQYYNTFIEPIKSPRLADMHVIVCPLSKFSKIKRGGHDLNVILAIHDDLDHKNAGEYYGFNSNRGKSIVIYEYLEFEDLNNPQEFSLDDLKFILGSDRMEAQAESTFVHEYFHYADDVGARQKSPQGDRTPAAQPEQGYSRYINSTREVNARYAQWILSVVESFSRLFAVKQKGIMGRFPRFDEFWHFYWDSPGFVPPELKKYASPSVKKRLTKRFYKFYEWIKTQQRNKAVIDDTRAITFVKKQILQDLSPEDKESLKSPGRYDVEPRY
jgi:hypothetical protein